MMTDSMGRCCRLAYWPMPRARLTATRNFWLPLRKATLIGFSPVHAIVRFQIERLGRTALALASPLSFKYNCPPERRSSTALAYSTHLLFRLPHEMQLQAILAEQFGQNLLLAELAFQTNRILADLLALLAIALQQGELLPCGVEVAAAQSFGLPRLQQAELHLTGRDRSVPRRRTSLAVLPVLPCPGGETSRLPRACCKSLPRWSMPASSRSLRSFSQPCQFRQAR